MIVKVPSNRGFTPLLSAELLMNTSARPDRIPPIKVLRGNR